MAATREEVLMGAFVGIETAHFYSSFLPSMMTIEKFAQDAGAVRALRQGEVLATSFALGLGYVVSRLMDSNTPLIFAAVTSALMLVAYESAIQGKILSRNPGALGTGLAIAAALPMVPP